MSSGSVVADAGCEAAGVVAPAAGGPERVAGDELVEHRRDVVPDLAVELAASRRLETTQQIQGQTRRSGHS